MITKLTADETTDAKACPAIDPAILAELRQSLPQDVRQSISPSASATSRSPSHQLGKGREILPGYVLEERLGSGGFGEVFLCSAPGGIKKAVKIVYGTLEEERADRERKSLERIRDVRHPFLVGLERVEIVDRQLVIITELADRSLKERYEECRQNRQPGIPREEILRYLKDAAEALDYLYEKHALQHLDVKPENLLLLGDHIKVGDFGLLKDLRDTQVSIVGGVTPLYAPPEVLDGQPTKYSDQYSLAIVYQEMLTGRLPFNGRTASQLASQHLHSVPELGPLPLSDRLTVGKALSKSPARRFGSCREFVDALLNPPKQAQHVASPQTESRVSDSESYAGSDVSQSPLLKSQPVSTQALPPIPQLAEGSGPTVVIGIGGLGSQVVERYRKRLNKRFGAGTSIPAIQLLAIDTDQRATTSLWQAPDSVLKPDEVLAIPLRSAQDYRPRKKSLQTWLSRRWLYNIPRSLQTEGVRPLGRLALVDHATNVAKAIDTAFTLAASTQSISRSNESTGLPFHSQPLRVFVVGSMSGGTASSTLLDVGYLAQACLDEKKIAGCVNGILLHHSSSADDRDDLAKLNTISTLGELYHYSRSEQRYPSDGAFTAAPIGRHPFASAYVADIADGADDETASAGVDRVATYLFGNTLGASARFFDGVRKIAKKGELKVRGFGICSIDNLDDAPIASPDAMCDAIIADWVATCQAKLVYGGDNQADETSNVHVQQAAKELVDRFGFANANSGPITAKLEKLAAKIEPLINRAWSQTSDVTYDDRVRAMHEKFDVAIDTPSPNGSLIEQARSIVEALSSAQRDDRISQIRDVTFASTSTDIPKLADSLETMFEIVRVLVAAQEAATIRADALGKERDRFIADNRPSVADHVEFCPDNVARFAKQYAKLRLAIAIEEAFASEIQVLLAESIGHSAFFTKVQQALEQTRSKLSHASETAPPRDDELLQELESRIYSRVLSRVGASWPLALAQPGTVDGFVRAIKQVAVDLISEFSLQKVSATMGRENVDFIRQAKPAISTQPGDIRWLLTGPSQAVLEPIANQVEAKFGVRPTIATSVDGSVSLYCEAEELPLVNVAKAIIGDRIDLLEPASRVRARQDIDWSC